MHKGQLATLADVLRHYNEAPDAMIGHNEAEPLNLSQRELQELEAFLKTLASPVAEVQAGGAASLSVNETTSSL
jgi:cytochrome c peroxidase